MHGTITKMKLDGEDRVRLTASADAPDHNEPGDVVSVTLHWVDDPEDAKKYGFYVGAPVDIVAHATPVAALKADAAAS